MLPFADKIIAETGLKEPFLAAGLRGPEIFQVNLTSFWRTTQIVYDAGKHSLVAKSRKKRFSEVLTDMHTRGGFGRRPGFLQTVWSVFVDIVQAAILVWVASGLYIWWHLKGLRKWGWLAVGAGFATFGLFLLGL